MMSFVFKTLCYLADFGYFAVFLFRSLSNTVGCFLASCAVLFVFACVPSAMAVTLEQMAGQMILVGFQGNSPNDASVMALREELAAGRIGGVMFLKTNVRSLPSVAGMNADFRAASPGLLPFIALDQEGGWVERLTKDVGFVEIPSAEEVARAYSPAQAQAIYNEMAMSIAALGFTVNFAPVADINLNPDNQIIARFGRAYGKDVETVVAYDKVFIAAHHEAGLLTTLKHFPGHGASTTDSHADFVDITRSWTQEELEPFRQIIADGLADMIMVGHLYHVDYADAGARTPSSLSRQWISGVLRGDLGFDGVVVSDDLEMKAVRDHFTLKETVTQAVRAGIDVLLFSNTASYRADLGREILTILMEEAAVDPGFVARIEQSYARIVAIKAQLR